MEDKVEGGRGNCKPTLFMRDDRGIAQSCSVHVHPKNRIAGLGFGGT